MKETQETGQLDAICDPGLDSFALSDIIEQLKKSEWGAWMRWQQYVSGNDLDLMAVSRLCRMMSSFVGTHTNTLGGDETPCLQLSLKWLTRKEFFEQGLSVCLKISSK